MTGTNTRARSPPRAIKRMHPINTAGMKRRLVLKKGMHQSRKGLANRWLMKRKKATSALSAQNIQAILKSGPGGAKRKGLDVLLKSDERTHWKSGQFRAPLEKTQLNQEINLQDFCSYLIDQLRCCLGGSSGREQVIDYQNARRGL